MSEERRGREGGRKGEGGGREREGVWEGVTEGGMRWKKGGGGIERGGTNGGEVRGEKEGAEGRMDEWEG